MGSAASSPVEKTQSYQLRGPQEHVSSSPAANWQGTRVKLGLLCQAIQQKRKIAAEVGEGWERVDPHPHPLP